MYIRRTNLTTTTVLTESRDRATVEMVGGFRVEIQGREIRVTDPDGDDGGNVVWRVPE